jgi:hypothetical protein
LEGPVHSNSQIHIYGSPVFQGIVTSTATSFYYYPGVPSNPTFNKGYELGVTPIDMDKYKNLQKLETLAISGGLRLNTDSRIELNSNGTLTYWLRTGGSWSSPVTLALPANGVLYIDGNAMVSGTLNGRITIVAENSMEIPSDITYVDPPTSPQCNDVLGLVAGSSIEVTKSSPSGSNLEIDGVLMAFDQSFGVRNFRTIPVMGELTVWGGIIQNYRGPVGTFNPSTGQQASGFSKDYRYDTRLVNNPPPYFPTTGEYKQDSWKEEPAIWE